MSFSAVIVVIVLVVMITALALDKLRPGLTLFSAAVVFMACGIITPQQMVAGFSNRGMITVALLFIVSEGMRRSGSINYLTNAILPKRKESIPISLAYILPSTAAISAFLNNTAVVIILAPMIKRWAEKMNLPATKFLIPLSYATIMGGLCTLVGTSTNLVVHGMMLEGGYKGFSMFELGQIGVVIAFVGIIYLVAFSNTLLPGDRILKKDFENQSYKEYNYAILITKGSEWIGTNIRRNKFTPLSTMDVCSIKRNGTFIETKGSTIEINEGDVIVLSGKSNSIEHILTTTGIRLSCLEGEAEQFARKAVDQVEVVIAPRFPGIGKSLKNFNFFRHYHAVVMAVSRNGEKIYVDLDSHVLAEGDTLVLITDGTFSQTWGEASSFYMVSETNDFSMPEKGVKKWIGIGLLLFMIIGTTFGERLTATKGVHLDMFFFVAIVAVAMTCFKLIPAKKYTKYVTWDILVAIASAFAISRAMVNSGIADSIASFIASISTAVGARGALCLLYLTCMVTTEIITNNAAVALCFPIAVALSTKLGVDPMPFFVAICVAASSSFSSPIGYQTNLIVQGVGGYKFKDYLRIGIPLNFITLIISIVLIPIIWKF